MKKASFLLGLGIFLFAHQNVVAETAGTGTKKLFSCSTPNGKTGILTKSGNSYIYSFGKSNSEPEITVKNSANQVQSNKWTGLSRYAYAERIAVALINGQYTYIVSSFFSTKDGENANIFVLKNNKKIAMLECNDWVDNLRDDPNIMNQESQIDDVIF